MDVFVLIFMRDSPIYWKQKDRSHQWENRKITKKIAKFEKKKKETFLLSLFVLFKKYLFSLLYIILFPGKVL